MKKARYIVFPSIVLAALAILHYWGAQFPVLALFVEHLAPGLISEDSWKRCLESDPTAHGYSAYSVLQDRDSNVAVPIALSHLDSSDPYIWMNAASYLGSQRRAEAIPYLIKALRHTAWHSDNERVAMLQELTGQNHGANFDHWLA